MSVRACVGASVQTNVDCSATGFKRFTKCAYKMCLQESSLPVCRLKKSNLIVAAIHTVDSVRLF